MATQQSYVLRARRRQASPYVIAAAGVFIGSSAQTRWGSSAFESAVGGLAGLALTVFGGFLIWQSATRVVLFSVDVAGINAGRRHIPWHEVTRLTTFYDFGSVDDPGYDGVYVEFQDGTAVIRRFEANGTDDDAGRGLDKHRLAEVVAGLAPDVPVADEPHPQWIFDREAELGASRMHAFFARLGERRAP